MRPAALFASFFALVVATSASAFADTLVVRAGQSIQAAVDRAAAGDKVLVMPGIYHEAGRPCPADPRATCIGDPKERVAGSLVSGFVGKGFASQGISLFCVDGFEVNGNVARDNGEYGIFPSHSAHGTVVGNVASGSNDTGIYVGQSLDVHVSGNLSETNVSGFEIENSTNVVLHPSALVPAVLAVDLAWDGSGASNCWSDNVARTPFPDPLPSCP